MTTASQIRKLVKPLLQRHPDLALVGPWLILTPLTHVFRAILIDRTSSANSFQPRTAVTYLCGVSAAIPLNWGFTLRDPEVRLWYWDDPRVPDTFLKAVEEQALPVLRAIKTLDDFSDYANSERFPHTPLDSYKLKKLIVDAARGDLEAAQAVCTLLVEGPHTCWDSPFYDFAVTNFCPLVAASDRDALARLLHEWEAQTVRTLKFEEFWEPTPFSFEMHDDRVATSEGFDKSSLSK